MSQVRLGVIGLGSVYTKYAAQIREMQLHGEAVVTAVYDLDATRAEEERRAWGLAGSAADVDALLAQEDVDAVLVLTSMNEHGDLAARALEAGKHVLVEKPMATSLVEAARLVTLSEQHPGLTLVCAPHVLLSPTYREIHHRVRAGVIGDIALARGVYGWSGPSWSPWFYQPGGGALFDLGVYNLTSLCGLMGAVRRVTALVGTAIPERVIDGRSIAVEADDNAQVLLDFGGNRFASITTGFTIQKYGHTPALELYGLRGTLHLLGDDWAPAGFEQWRSDAGFWEVFPESAPTWSWASGVRHLVECIATGRPAVTRPEQAYHVLEVMLAAAQSSAEGRVVDIHSTFPDPDYSLWETPGLPLQSLHDPAR